MTNIHRSFLGLVLVASLFAGCFAFGACESSQNDASTSDPRPNEPATASSAEHRPEPKDRPPSSGPEARRRERHRMVRRQIERRGVRDPNVLDAMRTVPRHEFVPKPYRDRAYADRPLPIGHDQTISQPYIVAKMTEVLRLEPEHEVLEIGTGSGYQAAVLGKLADKVYTIEIICDLAERARKTLEQQNFDNIRVRCGDGYKGWPKEAPFDRIIVTAAPPEVPDALVEQLAPGGRMVIPVGEHRQELRVLEKSKNGTVENSKLMDVRFVPMVHADESDAEAAPSE